MIKCVLCGKEIKKPIINPKLGSTICVDCNKKSYNLKQAYGLIEETKKNKENDE